jgi:putative transposase
MPRRARAIIANGCYHLINRGNNRAPVFHEPADYAVLLSLMGAAHSRVSMRMLAVCLMPNHLHLVVQPLRDDDVARWTHWLFTTHAARHHAKYQTTGRIWQGRFKAFAIQEDHHLLTVLRYVERNPLRARLVDRAEEWRWGSLHWRTLGTAPVALADWPVARPADWLEYVNGPQSVAELDEIRTSVNRQRPFGTDEWVERSAGELGMAHSLRRIGRPKRSVASAAHQTEACPLLLGFPPQKK